MTGWALPQEEITFRTTGRTAVVQDAPNVYAIFSSDDLAPYLDEFTEGKLTDPVVAMRITEEIVRVQMVNPRVARRGEEIPAGSEDVVPYEAIQTTEIDELVERWSATVERVARFREGHASPRSGKGGAGVGGKAKRPARPAAGKS